MGGHGVRGVAGQQDAAVAEPVGDVGGHRPVLHPGHVDPDVAARTEGTGDQAGPVRLLGVLDVPGVLGGGMEPDPAALGVDRAERAVRGEVDPGGLVGAPVSEIGVEHDGGEAPDGSGAGGADTEPLAHGGVRAVGGEHVPGMDAAPRAAPPVDEHGGDAFGLLGQVDEFGAEPQLPLGGGEERRLQPVLRGDHTGHRALGDRRVDPDHPGRGEVGLAQGVPEADPPVLRCERVLGDPAGEPQLAEDLHRPHVDQAGPGEGRHLGVLLDQQGRHTPAFQQRAGGEPDRPTADDQYRHLGVRSRHGPIIRARRPAAVTAHRSTPERVRS